MTSIFGHPGSLHIGQFELYEDYSEESLVILTKKELLILKKRPNKKLTKSLFGSFPVPLYFFLKVNV